MATTQIKDANSNNQLKVNADGSINVVGGGGGGGITSNVNVNNFPATQAVSGTVAVSNQPSTITVTQATGANLHTMVDNFPTSQVVTGTIDVGNFPTTQPVSGSVSVNNFPATQAVTVGNFPSTQPVSGTVAVNNFPSSQPVTGAFFQATQPVSGTVTVAQSTAANLQVSSNIVPLTTMKSFQQNVTTTATAIAMPGISVLDTISIKNAITSTVPIFIGDSTVTTATGYIISPGESVDIDISTAPYLVAASTVTAYILGVT